MQGRDLARPAGPAGSVAAGPLVVGVHEVEAVPASHAAERQPGPAPGHGDAGHRRAQATLDRGPEGRAARTPQVQEMHLVPGGERIGELDRVPLGAGELGAEDQLGDPQGERSRGGAVGRLLEVTSVPAASAIGSQNRNHSRSSWL